MSKLYDTALAAADRYLRTWLPGKLSDVELDLLREIGAPVSMNLSSPGGEAATWILQADSAGLRTVVAEPVCGYSMDVTTFSRLAAGVVSPQRAFYTFKIRISGNVLTALKLAGILEAVFTRHPATWLLDPSLENGARRSWRMANETTALRPLTDCQREKIRLHLHPREGAPYWIERARELGITGEEFQTFDDLAVFGPMDRQAQASRPFRDFLPRAVRERSQGLILGETGGTTGRPITAAWTKEDFEEAFLKPLPLELARRGIADLRQWLYAGPSGPHIIGKAARALARRTTRCDPLEIDFDPRWHRRLQPAGTAALRHLSHLVEQTRTLLERERPDALFITPSLLRALLEEQNCRAWSEEWRLVHLGGQSLSADERAWLVERLPAGCHLINGYGNSLFGCLIEDDPTRPLTYPAQMGERLMLRLVPAENSSCEVVEDDWGIVVGHRFDASRLIVNQVERDEARREKDGRIGLPRPRRQGRASVSQGVY